MNIICYGGNITALDDGIRSQDSDSVKSNDHPNEKESEMKRRKRCCKWVDNDLRTRERLTLTPKTFLIASRGKERVQLERGILAFFH